MRLERDEHTSVDNGKAPLATSRDEELCEWIVQVSDFDGTKPRDACISICLLDDLVFCCMISLGIQQRSSTAAPKKTT